ncbi:protein kinase [Candidatus Bathyarchaeota archaeon]|nr:MAG: protein kinase [Candidatus Bathyarchaeota archaeon]
MRLFQALRRKRKKAEKKAREKGPRIDQGVLIRKLEEDYQVVDSYPVHNPLAVVKIVRSPKLGAGYHYFVEEAPLNERERRTYEKLVSILSRELQPPEDWDVDVRAYIMKEALRIAGRYKRSLGKFKEESWKKIFYYVVRNLAGYGPLDVLMADPNIEDISCNGIGRPIYVWHRKYESVPTNLTFMDEQAANDFIVKLAHKGAKHISSAHPLLDAMLPEKHRLAATFMREVSTHGSTFCIRKFRSDPLSIIDLINFGTLDETLAAYFWMLLENKMSFLILGGTGAGKTSLLNALLSLLSENDKVITVEEVAELNPPHENWVQLVSRRGFQFGSSVTTNIETFDLVRLSLRYRPDYIIVGEVRGEEAYVLFQAVATGHGGLCTMHADSLDHAVKRLTSPPMNVAKVYIPLMNVALHVARVELPRPRGGLRFGRRVRSVMEILDYEDYNQISRWNPAKDLFETDIGKSVLLQRIAEMRGMDVEEVREEVGRRADFLRRMAEEGIRDQREVAKRILGYYEELRNRPQITSTRTKLKLIKSVRTLKNGKTITIWRYPKGAIDPVTGEKIGGRIARVER